MSTGEQRQSILQVVSRAQSRLARVAGRRFIKRRGLVVLIIAAAVGAARPLYRPLDDAEPLWLGVVIAVSVMVGLFLLGLVILGLAGRRRKPTKLGTARAVDEALGLREVVASGYAFERDASDGPLVEMARDRARVAAATFDPRSAFRLPSIVPRVRMFAVATFLAFIVAVVGSYHPALASILVSPPTEEEIVAATVLDQLAEELEHRNARPGNEDDRRAAPDRPDSGETGDGTSRSDEHRDIASRARTISKAARRGDRAEALRDLDDLGRTGRSAMQESAAIREALRQIASALESRHARPTAGSKTSSTSPRTGSEGGSKSGAQKSGSPQADADSTENGENTAGTESKTGAGSKSGARSASELLRQLAEKLRAPGKSGREGTKERRATLEALARAVSQSERAASKTGSASEGDMARRLAKALAKAGKSLGSGNRAKAAKQLEQAIHRAQEMEAARARAAQEAEAIARLLEAAGMLGKSMQMALAGQQGKSPGKGMAMGRMGKQGGGSGQGQGEGNGDQPGAGKQSSTDLARALALRLAALGLSNGDPSGMPGMGHEGSANNFRTPGARIPVKGSLRARSMVSEGDRAVTAIQGLGRSAEPTKEYQDVFPTYSALAEESMADEVIPAAQRHVVRRYFESIRPGGSETGVNGDASTGE